MEGWRSTDGEGACAVVIRYHHAKGVVIFSRRLLAAGRVNRFALKKKLAGTRNCVPLSIANPLVVLAALLAVMVRPLTSTISAEVTRPKLCR